MGPLVYFQACAMSFLACLLTSCKPPQPLQRPVLTILSNHLPEQRENISRVPLPKGPNLPNPTPEYPFCLTFFLSQLQEKGGREELLPGVGKDARDAVSDIAQKEAEYTIEHEREKETSLQMPKAPVSSQNPIPTFWVTCHLRETQHTPFLLPDFPWISEIDPCWMSFVTHC